MVLLRKTIRNINRWGFVLILFIPSILFAAKKPHAEGLSVEQEAQFKYYWYAAKQAITEERYADAYALLEFCTMIKPEDGQTLYFLGVIYQGLGQMESAYKTFEKAYSVQPKGTASEDLLEQLKRFYLADSQWKKALLIQDEIDQRSGYNAMSAISRYQIYAAQGDTKKAIKEIDRYLETDPTNMRFLLFRLELMEKTKAKPKALYAMYDRILALDPYNLMLLNNYAYHLATHGGDLKRAERMSEITIREQPNNPVFLDTYAWIMHLQGQDELALFYLKRALWNAPAETREEIERHIKAIENE